MVLLGRCRPGFDGCIDGRLDHGRLGPSFDLRRRNVGLDGGIIGRLDHVRRSRRCCMCRTLSIARPRKRDGVGNGRIRCSDRRHGIDRLRHRGCTLGGSHRFGHGRIDGPDGRYRLRDFCRRFLAFGLGAQVIALGGFLFRFVVASGLLGRRLQDRLLGFDIERRIQEFPRIGMSGGIENLPGPTLLDDGSRLHHRQTIGDMANHRQVVADDDVGKIEACLQIHQQVENLGLDRDVERRDRLVGDDQLGPGDQRASDRNALALAARELMGIFVEIAGIEADIGERFDRLGFPLRCGDVLDQVEGLGDDRAHFVLRIQRAERVLKNHLDMTTEVELPFIREREQVLALEADAARCRLFQREECPGKRRFTGTALADDAETLALIDTEGDAIHGLHERPLGKQALFRPLIMSNEFLDLEERLVQRIVSNRRSPLCG